MGGFEARTYRIEFEASHELHGLEASVRAASLGAYVTMWANARDDDVTAAQAEEFERQTFAGCLVSWNLIDPATGEPFPCTVEGIDAAPAPEVRAIKREWYDQTARVPDPLGGRSTSGATSSAAVLPMETPSEPRAS